MASDDCPVCLLYDRTCVAAALLEDALLYAYQTGGPLPTGVGGTIALAQRRIGQARQQLGATAHIIPGPQRRSLAVLGAGLDQALTLAEGYLTPTAMANLAGLLRECRQRAHAIAAVHFATHRGVAWTT